MDRKWTTIKRRKTHLILWKFTYAHHGVGIILGKEAQRALIGWQPVNHCIITTKFNNRLAKVTIIQAYAPTEASEDEEKEEFYSKLQDVINKSPTYDIKILMGDFNAQLGPLRQGCETILGPHGTSTAHNNNSERLISFCVVNSMTIGNTLFQHKLIHKRTWRSPDGMTLNEIDYICISTRWKSSLQDVRVRRGDVGSDHYMLAAKLHLKLKCMSAKQAERPLAVENLRDAVTAKKFKLKLRN